MSVCLYDVILLRRLWTVEKYVCKASAKLPGRRPPRHWRRRGQVNDGVMFGELRVLLLVCFRSVHGWMGMEIVRKEIVGGRCCNICRTSDDELVTPGRKRLLWSL